MLEATQFLLHVHPIGPWTLTAIHPDRVGTLTVTFTELDHADKWINAKIDDYNLYFQPNRCKPGTTNKASLWDIEHHDYAHCDIDHNEAGERLTKAKDKHAVAEKMIKHGATWVIDSGNGVQGLWRMVDAVSATTLAEINNGLIESLGGDTGTWQINQLMRLPHTTNMPNEKKRSKGLTRCPTCYLGGTEKGARDLKRVPVVHLGNSDEYVQSIGIESLSDLDIYRLPASVLRIIKHARDDVDEQQQDNHDRSYWLFRACCGMIRQGVPLGIVKGVIMDGGFEISELIEGHQRDPDDYANRQVLRARDAVQGEATREFEPEPAEQIAEVRERWKLHSYADLESMKEPDWVIERILPEKCFISVYGPPKSFKTFLVLDLVLCIATGRPFYGHAVRREKVLYVAGEGGFAIRKRIKAWLEAKGVEPRELDGYLTVITDPVAVNLIEERDEFEQFFLTVRRAGLFGVIVLDTLNKNFRGDENASKDMSNFVAGCEKLKRGFAGLVICIHHTGHNASRARGSSVLLGAVDVEISVKRRGKTDSVKFWIENMRDGPDGWGIYLKRIDSAGTCAFVQEDKPEEKRKFVAWERFSANLLDALLPMSQKELVKGSGKSVALVSRYLIKLVENKFAIKHSNGTYDLTDEGIALAREAGESSTEAS